MACKYTINGKEYSLAEFKAYLVDGGLDSLYPDNKYPWEKGGINEKQENYGVSESENETTDSGWRNNALQRPQVISAKTSTVKTGITKVDSPQDALHVVSSFSDYAQEQMVALVLGANNKILQIVRHTAGLNDQSMVDPGVLAGTIHGIKGAKSVYFAHNHPSGKSTQSSQDKIITKKLADLMEGTGIKVEGMLVTVDGNEGTFYDSNQPNLGDVSIVETQADRVKNVPVTERKLVSNGNLAEQSITDANVAIKIANQIANHRTGILLLNTQYQPVSFIEMNPNDMRKLRTNKTGTGASLLLKEIHETNARAMMMVIPEDKVELSMSYYAKVAENINAFAEATSHTKMLDGIIGQDSLADKRIDFNKSSVFFSKAVADRKFLDHAQANAEIPELTEAARKFKAGEITRKEWNEAVDKYKPVSEYTEIPEPASTERMDSALKPKQKTLINWAKDNLKNGDWVRSRLDIPAYLREIEGYVGGTWVVTLHEDNSKQKPISYQSTAIMNDVSFHITNENHALDIATYDKHKFPLATIVGKIENVSPEEAKKQADAALNDPSWVQVGMDPRRHSYFYTRKNRAPVVGGERAIQIGGLVLVKNPVYGAQESFLYSKQNQTKNPHTKTSLSKSITNTMDKMFGNGWTNRLFATGKFKIIDEIDALEIIGYDALYHKAWHGTDENDINIEAKYSKDGDIIAFYNPTDDTTYFVHDNISKDKPDSFLAGLMLHEISIHALQLGKSNKEFKALLDRFEKLKDTNPKFKEAFARVPEGTNPDHVTEEALAYFLENNPSSTFAQKIIELFRQIVRKLTSNNAWANELTEQELLNMATNALRSAPDSLIFYNAARKSENIKYEQLQERFYSALRKGFRDAPNKIFGNAQQIKLWLAGNSAKIDVKKDEIYWSGINDWLDMQTDKISKEDVLNYLDDYGVHVEDVMLGFTDQYSEKIQEWIKTNDALVHYDPADDMYYITINDQHTGDEYHTKADAERMLWQEASEDISQYEEPVKHNTDQLTLPNGKDYRELVVTIPTTEKFNESDVIHFGDTGEGRQIAWLRMNTRQDNKGGNTLFLEEVQSQRSQIGRDKGFFKPLSKLEKIKAQEKLDELKEKNKELHARLKDLAKNENDAEFEAVTKERRSILSEMDVLDTDLYGPYEDKAPAAPFVTDSNNKATNAYISLLLKKAISHAIDNNQNSISWTTGEQQSDRYDLSNYVDHIVYNKHHNGDWNVFTGENNKLIDRVGGKPLNESEIESYLGKDIARKIIAGEGTTTEINSAHGKENWTKISNLELKVGGEWAKTMYGDKNGLNAQGKPSLIMQAAMEIARKMSGEIGTLSLDIGKQPALIITPAMKDKILAEGMPLFNKAPRTKKPKPEGANAVTGDLSRVNKDVQDAVEEFISNRTKPEQERIRANLEKHKGTAWAAAAVKGMAYREMLYRAMEGRDITNLETNEIWGISGQKINKKGEKGLGRTNIVKAFKAYPKYGDAVIHKLIGSYDFVGGNRKAENDISTSFANCDPSVECAKHCYAAGSNARPSEIAKSEFTEFVLSKYPKETAKRMSDLYSATEASKAGLSLRLNDKGDLSKAQVELVKNLNKIGIFLQIFSKRPELLREISDQNLKMLSVDSSNMDVAEANPDLRLAVVITDDMTEDMLIPVHDRVSVYLPVNLKGRIITTQELKERFPRLYSSMRRETLCPVDGGYYSTKPDTSFVHITSGINKNAEEKVWTCTACDFYGAAGCFKGDRQTTQRNAVIQEQRIYATDIQKEWAIKKARIELQKQLDLLKELGDIDGELHEGIGKILTEGQSDLRINVNAETETGISESESETFGGNKESGGRTKQNDRGIKFSRQSPTQSAPQYNDWRDVAIDKADNYLKTNKVFNRLHLSIGTQQHKALKDKDFGRVFDASVAFENDTARFANESADYARSLLPETESLQDVLKEVAGQGFQRNKDAVKIADAIFQTTIDDKLMTENELKTAGYTPEQRVMYKEFFDAVNHSLDELGKSEMTRVARSLKMTDAPLDMSIKNTANFYANQADDPNIGKVFIDKADKITELKNQGYAPLSRFGRYTVDIVNNANGKREYFGMFESESDANEMAKAFKEEYPDSTISQGILSQKNWEMFKGVTPETMEAFARIMDVEQDKAFQLYLAQAINNRSAMKRLIHRKKIPGFAKDPQRILASFITSNAKTTSKNYNLGGLVKAISDIPKSKGDVIDEAVDLYNYVQNPSEAGSRVRGMLFAWYLGGSVASAFVNTTQTLTTTLPYLHQFGSTEKVASELINAMKLATKNASTIGGDLGKALHLAEEEGITAPHELHMLYGESQRMSITKHPMLRPLQKAWGSFFSLAEGYNRRVAFIAAYNLAKSNNETNPFKFASDAVNQTQFIYSKSSRPNWARGTVGSMVFTFKTFTINYIEFLSRLPTKERAIALGVLILMSGLSGLPGSDDADDILDTIGQYFGYNTNTKEWKEKVVRDMVGKDATNFALHGISSVLPFDIGSRLSVGNVIPGTAILKKSETDKAKDVMEFAGPAGSVLQKLVQAFEASQTRNTLLGKAHAIAHEAMPKAFSDAYQAMDMMQTGYYRDYKGKNVHKTDSIDATFKLLGFQPTSVSEPRSHERMLQQDIALTKSIESDIAELWANGVYEKDQSKVKEAKESLEDWNKKNPETPIKIKMNQILKRVKAMKQTSAERMLKTTPKELRGMAKEALSE